ncbi:AzlC family ABC transporter permease [Pseudomonas sp. DTU_2021_1001937_2_SI_NGA_ILE_001]|uniref:AzlC family ABC transporter permease n=1 Tax=Pseudomonas sp. DTU_2021_1001937_2_SI_NGA_ILE_001 TaxID=3077589 RepID=UPI0028FC1BEC|nr:AzlC family ABC transporter permease [Pseudomonas sp. DTU_2021_1001937_2_SI_NGA_ILE_001]WNW09806.1 AzlC family ABC transporter permease [Pseudomonas sp. DTU_2021_1001937_2_SI_NGA_ILE_001]
MIDPGARQAFMLGVRKLLPLIPGVIPFGLVTGVTAIDMGLSPASTLGMTALFYAGSAQMAALQLTQAGVVPIAIVVTALIINLRFIMYGAVFAAHLQHLPRRITWPAAYLLSDQSFALCSLRASAGQHDARLFPFYLGTAISMWLAWMLSVAAGVYVGASIPGSWSLSFAIPLSFLALLVPGIRNAPSLGAAVVGGLLAVLLVRLPYNLGLVIGSVCGIATGVWLEQLRRPAFPATEPDA